MVQAIGDITDDVSKILRINNQDRERSIGFKLENSDKKTEVGRNWFSNIVVGEQNGLSDQNVNTESFKNFEGT